MTVLFGRFNLLTKFSWGCSDDFKPLETIKCCVILVVILLGWEISLTHHGINIFLATKMRLHQENLGLWIKNVVLGWLAEATHRTAPSSYHREMCQGQIEDVWLPSPTIPYPIPINSFDIFLDGYCTYHHGLEANFLIAKNDDPPSAVLPNQS